MDINNYSFMNSESLTRIIKEIDLEESMIYGYVAKVKNYFGDTDYCVSIDNYATGRSVYHCFNHKKTALMFYNNRVNSFMKEGVKA